MLTLRKRRLTNSSGSSPPRKKRRASPTPDYESRKILEHKGSGKSRKYLVKYVRYSWETRDSLPMGLVYEYHDSNRMSQSSKKTKTKRAVESEDDENDGNDDAADHQDVDVENINPNITFEEDVPSDEDETESDPELRDASEEHDGDEDDKKLREGEEENENENENENEEDGEEEERPRSSVIPYILERQSSSPNERNVASFNDLVNLDRTYNSVDVRCRNVQPGQVIDDDDVKEYEILEGFGEVDESNGCRPVWKVRALTAEEKSQNFLQSMKLPIWISENCWGGKKWAMKRRDFEDIRCDYEVGTEVNRIVYRFGLNTNVNGIANGFVRWGCDGNPYLYLESDFVWSEHLSDQIRRLSAIIPTKQAEIDRKRAEHPAAEYRRRVELMRKGIQYVPMRFEEKHSYLISSLTRQQKCLSSLKLHAQAVWGDSMTRVRDWHKVRRFQPNSNYTWRELPRLFSPHSDSNSKLLAAQCARASMNDVPFFVREVFQFDKCLREILRDELKFVPKVIQKLIADYTTSANADGFSASISLVPYGVDACASRNYDFSCEWFSTYILQANCSQDNAASRCEVVFGNVDKVSDRARELMAGVPKEYVQQNVLRNLTTTLHLYQIRNCLWACDLERSVLANREYVFGANDLYVDYASPHFNGESSYFGLALDHAEQEIYEYNGNDENRRRRYLTTRGGILADEVGLGKTLSMISVIAAHGATVGVLNQLDCVKATMVVCPNHLVHQWKDQVETHTRDGALTVYEVSTKKTFEAMTPSRLANADVIVVSFQFLLGNFYKKYRWVNKSWLQRTRFYRLIVDEGHELTTKQYEKAKEVVLSLNAVLYWYLSGTPFPKPSCLAFCCELIRLQVCDKPPRETDFLLKTPVGDVIEQVLGTYCFMRNTKSSIVESSIPQRLEMAAFVDLHPIERVVYQIQLRRDPKTAQKVCNDIFSNFENRWTCVAPTQLGEIPSYMIRKNNDELRKLERNVLYYRKQVRNARLEGLGPKAIQERQYRVAREQNEMEAVKAETVMLRSHDLQNQILRWNYENKGDPVLKQITLERGSKFAQALNFIRDVVQQDRCAHVICFSNFDRVLEKYHSQLSSMGVSCGFCAGNVFVRRRAMRGFQSQGAGSVRVIFLSIKKAASGADLKNATHVCLLDPVGDSLSKSVADEEQAAGRALRQGMGRDRKCKVIRFIARDTVEQDIFVRNKNERKRRREERKKEAKKV